MNRSDNSSGISKAEPERVASISHQSAINFNHQAITSEEILRIHQQAVSVTF